MCGINGILTNDNVLNIGLCIRKMNNAIVHRGPDNSGIWINEGSKIALGHRRLSILDLSNAGNQPMTSRCQRYILTFNGEIYNHLELRKELNGPWLGILILKLYLRHFHIGELNKLFLKLWVCLPSAYGMLKKIVCILQEIVLVKSHFIMVGLIMYFFFPQS